MSAYIPMPFRSPNQVTRQFYQPFDDGAGHVGLKCIVEFRDKKGRAQSMVMSIKWGRGRVQTSRDLREVFDAAMQNLSKAHAKAVKAGAAVRVATWGRASASKLDLAVSVSECADREAEQAHDEAEQAYEEYNASLVLA